MALGILRRGNTKVGVETLRDDIRRLSDDFGEAIYTAGQRGKETIAEGGKRLGSALKTLGESAKSSVDNAYEQVSHHGKEAVEISRRKIAIRPITSVLAALAAGLVVGVLIKR